MKSKNEPFDFRQTDNHRPETCKQCIYDKACKHPRDCPVLASNIRHAQEKE
ncbi:Uncharacterised protein [uncultured archaeon]|nr:Uncharacterised protein [uncultured archaeon]